MTTQVRRLSAQRLPKASTVRTLAARPTLSSSGCDGFATVSRQQGSSVEDRSLGRPTVLHPDVGFHVDPLVTVSIDAQSAESVRDDVVARVGEGHAGPALTLLDGAGHGLDLGALATTAAPRRQWVLSHGPSRAPSSRVQEPKRSIGVSG